MKALLLHPEDRVPAGDGPWDLIVDLGRAPAAIYAAWSQQSGGRLVSVFDYARGFEDLYRLKQLLHHGTGLVVDRCGIDWWEAIVPLLMPDLEQAIMLRRLAQEVGSGWQLYCSRPDRRASGLQSYLGLPCVPLSKPSLGWARKFRHYREAFARLDFTQLKQIAHHKLDPEHAFRRRFARKKSGDRRPVVLLPTTYVNTSRAAVAYAKVLPEMQFLLAVASSGGRLASLPNNVRMISLEAYFRPLDAREIGALTEKWEGLRSRLVADHPEFRMADALGMFQRIPGLMRWGIAARDAWERLFESEQITACFSADEAHPHTNIPLVLATRRGMPTLAVHHGALDYRISTKEVRSDYYLAKGELEQDYLLRQCRMSPEKIVMGSPPQAMPPVPTSVEKPWLVFFTEPYMTGGWRIEEVYRDLLPRLIALARTCELKLVFKLHPFESVKGHRNLVRKFVTAAQFHEFRWISGPPSSELWNQTRFAVTVESTIALECAVLGIPVFLCAWLQSPYGGYSQQYAKFGAGHILNSPDQLPDIPRLLADKKPSDIAARGRIWRTIEPQELRALLTGKGSSVPAVSVRTAMATIP